MRESRVHASDLILPVFVLDGQGIAQDVASMPGVQRLTLDRLSRSPRNASRSAFR